jgi:hypothetical protein
VAVAGDLPPHYDDAPLHGVQFIDHTEGWAVGGQGVIWHTIDGGQTWERQKSGTRATLLGVQFQTPYIGYCYGRAELPGALGGTGVILATKDGGLTWTETAGGALPGIHAGRFFGEANGLVACEPTAAYPTGLFTTTDGGQSWKPLDGPKGLHWTALDCRDATRGLLVAKNGLAVVDGGRPKAIASPGFTVTAALLTDGYEAYGRDDRGKPKAARSFDGGATWQSMPCDSVVQAISRDVRVGRTGVAGLPNSLNAVYMHTAEFGWAVGELGAIVHTTDGGKTWSVQKVGGQRLGVLIVASSPTAIPFDAIAKLGAVGGYFVGVVCTDESCDQSRLETAVRACGGAFARTAVRRGELHEIIGLYQPDTVIIDQPALLAGVTAMENVSAVFTVTATTADATVQWDHTTLVPALADTVAGHCDIAASLLGPAVTVPPYRFFKRIDATKRPVDAGSLVAEARLPRGGSARRKQPAFAFGKEYLAAVEPIAKARMAVMAIVADPAKAGGPEKALVEMRNALVGMPEDVAARTAALAAAEFARRGQWGYAREVHAFIAEAFPTMNDAAESCRWLVRFHTSAEIDRRIELGHVKPLPPTIFDTVVDSLVKQATHTETADALKPVYRFKTGITARQWSQMAIDLEPKLAAFGPLPPRDPATVRGLMLARERLGLNGFKLPEAAKTIDAPTAAKPTLDGTLDDACWAGDGTTFGTGTTTTVKFARDGEYVYVAITAVGRGEAPTTPRERDADLAGRDRVEIEFDVTRGGDTPFTFAVDHRGRLAESCWGDATWNPKWFVAFKPGEQTWTAEIAIPLAELTGRPVANTTWGVRVNRRGTKADEAMLVPAWERCDLRFR